MATTGTTPRGRSRPADSDDLRRARRLRFVRRQAGGRIVLRVEIHEHDFARAIMRSTRLTADQALRRNELERAVSEIVSDFIERWHGTRPLE
jgi:hypothetical protein